MLAIPFVVAWTLMVVPGMLPTLELLVSGNVFLRPSVPKIALLIIAPLAIMAKGQWKIPRSLTVAIIAFSCYLILCCLVWSATLYGDQEQHALVTLVGYYLNFFVLVLSFGLQGSLSARQIILYIVILSLPIEILGIAQHFTDSPIIPEPPAGDRNFHLNSTSFFGQLRGYSLFSSGLEFGHFIVLASGILCALTLSGIKRLSGLLALVLLGVAALAVYSTLTRAAYIQLALTLFSVTLLIWMPWFRRRLFILVLGYGLIGAFISFAAPLIQGLFSGSSLDLADNESFLMRVDEWQHYGVELMNAQPLTLFFGTGITQDDEKDITFDNGPLAVAYQIGLLGLMLWSMLMYVVVRYASICVSRRPSALTLGISAYMTTWLYSCMLNIAIDDGARMAILLVLAGSSYDSVRQQQSLPRSLKMTLPTR